MNPHEQPYNRTFVARDELSRRLKPHVAPTDLNSILSAYDMAQTVHQYQKRNDGTPYFWHVTRVTRILMDELGMTDPDILIGALLHDALEDSDVLTPEVLEYNFGAYVRYMVEVLTKDVHIKGDQTILDQINRDYVDKLKKSTADCKLIKLSDRLDNSRCLQFNLKVHPYKYIRETIDNYLMIVPQAAGQQFEYLITEIHKAQSKYLA